MKREEQGTTGIGEGIAIPHGKSSKVKKACLAAMVIPNGVDFEALDNKKVNLMFLIAAPETKDNIHLEVLSILSALLGSVRISFTVMVLPASASSTSAAPQMNYLTSSTIIS